MSFKCYIETCKMFHMCFTCFTTICSNSSKHATNKCFRITSNCMQIYYKWLQTFFRCFSSACIMFQICFKYFKETCSSGCKCDSTATFKHAKWFKCVSHALQQSAQIAVSMLQMLQNNFKLYANILQMTATIL